MKIIDEREMLKKKSHTYEGRRAHLRISFGIINELEKQIIIKKTVEVGQ